MDSKTKKSALMIVDGGHLRALMMHDSRNPAMQAPLITAENVDRILRACVQDDEDLQRIYYYDCSEFTGHFNPPHPDWAGKECIALHESDLKQRIKRGSKFHILNPYKREHQSIHTKGANTAVWIARQGNSRMLDELAQKELFAVRHGKMKFNGWQKSKRKDGPEYFPSLQQKGVDMLIGLDIATIAITGQAERIIFIANDTDFVPALKFARRTGRKVQVVIAGLPGGQETALALKMNSDYRREVAWPKDLEIFRS